MTEHLSLFIRGKYRHVLLAELGVAGEVVIRAVCKPGDLNPAEPLSRNLGIPSFARIMGPLPGGLLPEANHLAWDAQVQQEALGEREIVGHELVADHLPLDRLLGRHLS
ncbi:hypothetical protein ES703_05930 [subsurface metagenome]